MAAKILISNKVGNLGGIVGVVSGDHVFSANETLDAWIDSGGTFENWVAKFAVLTVTGKSVDELRYLSDPLVIDSEPQELGRYYFEVPPQDSAEFLELYQTGGIVADWSVISPYLMER